MQRHGLIMQVRESLAPVTIFEERLIVARHYLPRLREVWRNDIEAPSDYLEFDFQKLVTLSKIKWQKCSDDYGAQSAIQGFSALCLAISIPKRNIFGFTSLIPGGEIQLTNDPVPGAIKNDGTPDMCLTANRDSACAVEAVTRSTSIAP